MSDQEKIRLSDRIISALDLSLEQGDLHISEKLYQALEMSMTRNAGGGEFIERRDYPAPVRDAAEKLSQLRNNIL